MIEIEEIQFNTTTDNKLPKQGNTIPAIQTKNPLDDDGLILIKKQSSREKINYWGETKITLETQTETDRRLHKDNIVNNNTTIIKDNESNYSKGSTISYTSVLNPIESEAFENDVERNLKYKELSSPLPSKSRRQITRPFVDQMENTENVVKDFDKGASFFEINSKNMNSPSTVLPAFKDFKDISDNNSVENSYKDNECAYKKILHRPVHNLISKIEVKLEDDIDKIQPKECSRTTPLINLQNLQNSDNSESNKNASEVDEQEEKVEDLDELFLLLKSLLDKNEKLAKIEKPEDLIEGNLIKELLIEIEPLFNSVTYQIDTTEENGFTDKYNNFVIILNILESFATMNGKKLKNFNAQELIDINLLLQHKSKQLKNLIVILICLCSFSSEKTFEFLEKAKNLDERLFNFFIEIADKYIIYDDKSKSPVKFCCDSFCWRKLNPGIFNLSVAESIFYLEQKRLLLIIKQNDCEMGANIEKVINLTSDNKLLIGKVDDLTLETELLRSTNSIKNDSQIDFIVQFADLKSELEIKENKIKNLEQQLDKEKKVAFEDKIKFKEELNDVNINLRCKAREYENIKNKIEELQVYKDRVIDFENFKKEFEVKKKELLERDEIINKLTNEVNALKGKDDSKSSDSVLTPIYSINNLNLIDESSSTNYINNIISDNNGLQINKPTKTTGPSIVIEDNQLNQDKCGANGFKKTYNKDNNKNDLQVIENFKSALAKIKSEKDIIELQRDKLWVSLERTALGNDIVEFDNKKLIQKNKNLSQIIINQNKRLSSIDKIKLMTSEYEEEDDNKNKKDQICNIF